MNLSVPLRLLVTCLLIPLPFIIQAQQTDTSEPFTLETCIQYALKNQPYVQQSRIGEEVALRENQVRLADWLPQATVTSNLTHYLRLPTSVFPDFENPESGQKRIVQVGVVNNSNALFQVNQTIFSNEVRLAARTASQYRLQAEQNTTATKIDAVVNVSKAFYDLLITRDQLDILNEDIVRLEKNVRDATNLYKSGITDNIDYKRATIQLNSARAQRKVTTENIPYKYAVLKQLIGYPNERELEIEYDTARLRDEVILDTLQTVNYNERVEFRRVETQLSLQEAGANYYRWGFLPTVSAFANYNFVYLNDEFQNLYDRSFPQSQLGLQVVMPLFQGLRRMRNVQIAELQLESLQLDRVNLRNQISTEFSQAMATYKGALSEWQTLEENERLAREVYNTVKLQYDEGVKTYLEVIVAETDLRSAQLNARNALLQALASKLDVQRATGTIPVNE